MIAKVVLNSRTSATDRLFDYNIPESLSSEVTVGKRVIVPFGRGDKTVEAFVLYVTKTSEYDNLKSVAGVVDEYTYFTPASVELMEFMRHRYFCSYISAVKCIVPAGLNMKFTSVVSLNREKIDGAYEFSKNSVTASRLIALLETYGDMTVDKLKSEINKNNVTSVVKKLEKRGFVCVQTQMKEQVSDTTRTHVELIADRNDAYSVIDSIQKKAPARARALEILCENPDIELSELLEYASTGKQTIDALVKSGYALYYDVVHNETETDVDEILQYVPKNPTAQQKYVSATIAESIGNNLKDTFLIHGVTGSGKTEVYLELIAKAVGMNKNAIMLVPEISLTPQMISQVYSRFGDDVAVIHSRLTVKQRFNEWKKIKNGDVKIAIGARSAIFAPFDSVGLIIIDEEHENTYKSEMSPKYNALEIARLIARQHNAVLVLASATPSVDSYFKAITGSYKLLEMTKRVNNSPLPEVTVVDMREEFSEGNMSIFSERLKEKMKTALEKKEQIILFLNRRGFSGFVSCRNCGYVMECPNCNVSLKYHKYTNRMICHYCDYKTDVKTLCPSCSSRHIRYFGIGTERVAEEIAKIFPEAAVLRMDADTTTKKNDHEKIIRQFRNHEADILVGTQMITKGLDFENVTLVGIVAADMSLNVDDFRAGERTFDLITQVTGRAGRSQKKGEAVIQTYNPDDEVILRSAAQDYKNFYESEIKLRQMLVNPPFSEYINFLFVSVYKSEANRCAQEFYRHISGMLSASQVPFTLFKPCETGISKLGGKYRYHFLLKMPYKKDVYDTIREIYDNNKSKYGKVTVLIEVNPNSMQ